MRKPVRVKLSRAKGWRKPPHTVVVSRPSKWGNPFLTKDNSVEARRAAVARYTIWLHETHAGRAMADAACRELHGCNLACWCPLDQPCHADVLLMVANARGRRA